MYKKTKGIYRHQQANRKTRVFDGEPITRALHSHCTISELMPALLFFRRRCARSAIHFRVIVMRHWSFPHSPAPVTAPCLLLCCCGGRNCLPTPAYPALLASHDGEVRSEQSPPPLRAPQLSHSLCPRNQHARDSLLPRPDISIWARFEPPSSTTSLRRRPAANSSSA